MSDFPYNFRHNAINYIKDLVKRGYTIHQIHLLFGSYISERRINEYYNFAKRQIQEENKEE